MTKMFNNSINSLNMNHHHLLSLSQQELNTSFQFNYNMNANYCQSQLDYLNNEQNRISFLANNNNNASNATIFKSSTLRLPKATFTHPYQRQQYNNIQPIPLTTSYSLEPSSMRLPLANISSNQISMLNTLPMYQSIQSKNMKAIEGSLNEILKSSKPNDSIFKEINELFDNPKDEEFKQALSRSIVRSCFNTLDSFNLTTLKTRLALLSLFIIDRNQQEIELTNALKAVANDYNINNELLQNIYTSLYKNELVKLAVFLTKLNHIELDKLLNTSSDLVSNQLHDKATCSNPNKHTQTKNLFTSQIKVDKKTNDENEKAEVETCCPICINTLSQLIKQKVKLMSGSCGHVMCLPCANAYFNFTKKKSIKECPICRKSVAASSVHQIYI